MISCDLNKSETYIVYLLEKHVRLSAAELGKYLDAAPSTVRRILMNMESKGLIIRTYGGAMSVDYNSSEAMDRKMRINTLQKNAIAEAAREMINEGDTIALGDGSTVAGLCSAIREFRNLIVLTDSMYAANILMPCQDVEVHICNGIVQGKTGHIIGTEAVRFFQERHVDKTFIGADSVSAEEGVGSSNILISNVERSMLACADKKIILCDSSKIGKKAVVQVEALDGVDLLITDAGADPAFADGLQEQGVEVMRVGE